MNGCACMCVCVGVEEDLLENVYGSVEFGKFIHGLLFMPMKNCYSI